MSEENYRKLGFKCGLEIHQQLLTNKKLFCNCPAGYRNDTPDAEIIRHMRPTLSELGEYDGTALMEFKTKKRVIYQLFRDNMCTYEMDDTPPFVINKEALDIAIKLALMLNCAIVDELHVSRKQYLDGSIPTGFQRTAVVGVGGWVPYKGRKIQLSHICLEEDACREVSDIGHTIVFRTDRLSIPLLEVITEPVLETPQEAREVNELIGRMLKASGLVRRGIGSVRQDVNVSIAGGTRVELKGIDKTGHVDKLTANEAHRQFHLLQIRDELKSRGFAKGNFPATTKNVTQLLANSPSPIIARAIGQKWQIGAVRLPGFGGLLKREIQPGRSFADEFAGRVKVIACIDIMPNLATPEIQLDGLAESDWSMIERELKANEQDALIMTWGPAADVITAMNEIVIRAEEALIGIPNETRQHLGDYTTGFERILPGPDRMYPDTDSPPVTISACKIAEFESNLPARAWDIEAGWEKLGLPEHLAQLSAVSPVRQLFSSLLATNTLKPSRLYALLRWAYLRNPQVVNFDAEILSDIIRAMAQGRISTAATRSLLASASAEILKNDFEKILHGKDGAAEEIFERAIDGAITESTGRDFKNEKDKLNFLTGSVIARLDGGNGQNIKEQLRKRLH